MAMSGGSTGMMRSPYTGQMNPGSHTGIVYRHYVYMYVCSLACELKENKGKVSYNLLVLYSPSLWSHDRTLPDTLPDFEIKELIYCLSTHKTATW